MMKRLHLASLLTLGILAAACGGSTPPPEPPPSAPETPSEPAAPATPAPTDQAAPAGGDAAKPAEPAAAAPTPAPKPAKEKIIGQWQFEFVGEPRTAAEAEAKKKAGKDEKKYEQILKDIETAAKSEWIEFTADGYYVSHVADKDGKDKVIFKVKYEVAKEEGNTLTMKPVGKDEISKKEIKAEVPVTFKDDNTIDMKDPSKKMTLTFKRK